MNKKAFILVFICCLALSSVSVYADDNVYPASAEETVQPTPQKTSFWSKFRKKKQNHATQEQSEIPEINKNLVAPNESPGIMTDTERTRRYYESFEGAHRTEIQQQEKSKQVIEDDIVLPARVQQGGISVRINKVEITDSAIFSDNFIVLSGSKTFVQSATLISESFEM